jgi:SAM-dependent methyltransferase
VIADDLLALLRCPLCSTQPIERSPDGTPTCPGCGRAFQRGDGYLIAPADDRLAGRPTNYHQAAFATTLAFRQVAQPLLGAAVRQRWLVRWLLARPPGGPVLEIGCGDGRFAYWNHRQASIVGLDPVPLFSREALASVNLIQADGRALPFADGSFAAAYSIDVLEHLDEAGLAGVMSEAHRVLQPGGRLFIFTNSREPSTFQPIISAERRLSGLLRQRGIGDFTADDLRKGDHVKALATFEDFVTLATQHRFAVLHHRFWNGIAQGLVDNVLVRLGEHLLLRRQSHRPTVSRPTNELSAATTAAGPDQRQAVSRQRPVALVLQALTLAMQADVELLGRFRSGPFFALLERR